MNGVVHEIVTVAGSILTGSTGGALVTWLLRSRQRRIAEEEARAGTLSHYQQVVESLWERVLTLEARISALESEIERLTALVRAYERKFGRRFRITAAGKVVEIRDGQEQDLEKEDAHGSQPGT